MRNDVTLTLGNPSPNIATLGQLYGYILGVPTISTVISGGGTSGAGPNAPSGMNVFVDTGPITVAPSQVVNGTWTAGGATFTNFSPTTKSSAGEWAGNISLDTSGVGWRLTYDNTLTIGNSPVRYGTGKVTLAGTPTGLLYSYRTVVFSSNFTEKAGTGMKLYEPRTANQGNGQGLSTNFVGTASYSPDATHLSPGCFLQGPNGQSVVFLPPSGTGVITGGASHTVEEIWQQDQPLGASNATYTLWVDNVLVLSKTGLTMMVAGMTIGWNFWLTDPTYGGATGSNPPFSMYWTMKSLYLAGK
jgi:hypothetical protein